MYREFEEYVFNNYDMKLEGISSKYYHSKRVAILSKKLAQELNFNFHEVRLATQIGLLHDIARFYEYTRYGTFTNIKTFDHGYIGTLILKNDNFIKKFNVNDSDEETLYAAIRNHNKLLIEKKYINNKFCKLIRDADKADILYKIGNSEKFTSKYNGLNASTKIHNDFMNHKAIDEKNIKTYVDNVLCILGFIYDINYDVTLKLIDEMNYLDKIYNLLENKEIFKRYFNEVSIYIEMRLKNARTKV